MAYTIDGKLKVAVSSRALFQLEKEDEIFTTKGKEAYEKYQIKHEKDILTDFRDLVNCSGAGSAYVETDDL